MPMEKKKNVDPKMVVILPMVLCMQFAHGFEHDGFLPMVLCRSSQGNYNYFLIEG